MTKEENIIIRSFEEFELRNPCEVIAEGYHFIDDKIETHFSLRMGESARSVSMDISKAIAFNETMKKTAERQVQQWEALVQNRTDIVTDNFKKSLEGKKYLTMERDIVLHQDPEFVKYSDQVRSWKELNGRLAIRIGFLERAFSIIKPYLGPEGTKITLHPQLIGDILENIAKEMFGEDAEVVKSDSIEGKPLEEFSQEEKEAPPAEKIPEPPPEEEKKEEAAPVTNIPLPPPAGDYQKPKPGRE